MNKIDVLYDYQVFCHNKYGGTSRYFIELLTHMAYCEDISINAFFGFYQNKYSNTLIKKNANFFKGVRVNFPGVSSFLKSLNRKNFDNYLLQSNLKGVFHATYYDLPENIPSNFKTVITIHDMIPEKLQNFNYNDKSFINKKTAALRSDAIIAVSNNTKQDIIDIFNIDPEKIFVIHHGCSILNVSQKDNYNTIKKPYVLFIGRRHTYKNFPNMLKAFLSSNISEQMSLVCVGGGKFNNEEEKMIGDFKNIIQVNASDETLVGLYKNAEFLIVPSLYEGFGLPVLEGMALGCPVIASDTSSIPEVLGDAGMYFDPYSIESITNAFNTVAFDSDLKSEMINKGFLRSKDFSWEKCALKTIQLYKNIL